MKWPRNVDCDSAPASPFPDACGPANTEFRMIGALRCSGWRCSRRDRSPLSPLMPARISVWLSLDPAGPWQRTLANGFMTVRARPLPRGGRGGRIRLSVLEGVRLGRRSAFCAVFELARAVLGAEALRTRCCHWSAMRPTSPLCHVGSFMMRCAASDGARRLARGGKAWPTMRHGHIMRRCSDMGRGHARRWRAMCGAAMCGAAGAAM